MESLISRRDAESAISSEYVVQRDPFLRLFYLKWKWRTRHVIVFMSFISALLFFGAGLVASSLYSGPGTRLETPVNLGFLVFWVLVLSPLLWGAYIWQARSIPHLIEDLATNGILGDFTSDNFKKAIDQAKVILGQMIWKPSYVIAAISIVLFWVIASQYIWTTQYQENQYWFVIKWYFPIRLFAHSIGLFVLILLIFRQMVFVAGLFRLFSRIEVKIKPLDPDEGGGLGALGNFAKASLWFSIGLGLIAVSYGLFTSEMGTDLLHRFDLVAFYGLYIILVPVALLAPILSVRSAMLRARSEVLRPIAQEFQEILARAGLSLSTANTDLKDLDDTLTQLQRHRELIIDTYPTVPISIRSLRRFSLTALLPLASGILSLVLQLFEK